VMMTVRLARSKRELVVMEMRSNTQDRHPEVRAPLGASLEGRRPLPCPSSFEAREERGHLRMTD
jgi:hypothetical protein